LIFYRAEVHLKPHQKSAQNYSKEIKLPNIFVRFFSKNNLSASIYHIFIPAILSVINSASLSVHIGKGCKSNLSARFAL
jgi:hypothetical protein